MINRMALVCTSCGTKVVTRTAIGHHSVQEHEFACPRCGVKISFALNIDHDAVDFSYREPTNAAWADSEEGAVDVLVFDAERVVPDALPDLISPYIATVHNITDREAYARDEMLRLNWRQRLWPIVQRMLVHFEKGHGDLLDKEAASLGLAPDPATAEGRLRLLNRLQESGFTWFAMRSRGQSDRIRQRLAAAGSISPQLLGALADQYVDTGRMARLWTEIQSVRGRFLEAYPSLSPLVQLRYWTEPPTDLGGFGLSDKRFDLLRNLYIDAFETLCRLLAMAIGVECIIHHRSLALPTRKGTMSIWEFEGMANGTKPDIVTKYPIADPFLAVIDSDLRNGIGHHSAHYVGDTDDVVYWHGRGPKSMESRLPYACFAHRALELGSVFELAVIYHSTLHMHAGGRM